MHNGDRYLAIKPGDTFDNRERLPDIPLTDEPFFTDDDASDVNPVREFALKRMDDFWLRGLRLLAQYKGNRNMALDCFLLAHGQGEMVGLQTAVEVAVKHFGNAKRKAAVTKCILMFQDCLNIGNMPGQRSSTGRKQMAAARKNQLQ